MFDDDLHKSIKAACTNFADITIKECKDTLDEMEKQIGDYYM